MRYCQFCGKQLGVAFAFCAYCGKEQNRIFGVVKPVGDSVEVSLKPAQIGKTCPYCQTVIKPGVSIIICPACGIPHHGDCWTENGNKCTTFGCSGQAPADIRANVSQGGAYAAAGQRSVNVITAPALPYREVPRPADEIIFAPAQVAARTPSGTNDRPRREWLRWAVAATLLIALGVSILLNSTITWTSADGTYTGQVRWGKRHGRGTLVSADGYRYTSNWVNGFAIGPGELILPDGKKYTGNFDMARKQAAILIDDGSRYTGGFENNRFNGRGTLILLNGTKYNGGFRDGKKSGSGTIRLTNGTTFEGGFRDDEPEGKAIIKKSNGEIIEGVYGNGRQDGEFRRFPVNSGLMYVSLWQNGTQVGAEEVKAPLILSDIRIRNSARGGIVINDWNTRFPKSQIRYILYEAKVASLSPHPISGDILVKYIQPDRYINRNPNTSPPGGTSIEKINGDGKIESGWGNNNISTYDYGRHYIQFFWQGIKIGEANFDVY